MTTTSSSPSTLPLSPSARAVALQMLYALDAGTEFSLESSLPLLRAVLLSDGDDEHAQLASLDDFDDAVPLVQKVVSGRSTIDERIRKHSKSWRLERMAQLDRNLLRLMLQLADGAPASAIPEIVAEAGELAKRYGTAESIAFVTGLLERCLQR